MDNNVTYDASLDAQMEERNEVEQIRDSSESIKVGNSLVGKIKEYKFKILDHSLKFYGLCDECQKKLNDE